MKIWCEDGGEEWRKRGGCMKCDGVDGMGEVERSR